MSDPKQPKNAETVIAVCGPPKGCTCPAVAWYCVCGAGPMGLNDVLLAGRTADTAAASLGSGGTPNG